MRILVIKTTSMGDIIHAFPALTDISRRLPQAKVEWVAEESFAELPSWHSVVIQTHQVAWRRWRAKPLAARQAWREWRTLKKELCSRDYDCIIDAQYLLKSALIGKGLAAPFHGVAKGRDMFAALFYSHHHKIPARIHAVERIRLLFSLSLGYEIEASFCDFGLSRFARAPSTEIFLLPNTSKARKTLPIKLWQELIGLLARDGYSCVLPGHTAAETEVARSIAAAAPDACIILPPSSLTDIAARLGSSAGAVAVDTGLAHLATAIRIPVAALFTVSNPRLFGCYGRNAINLVAQRIEKTEGHPHLDIRPSRLGAQEIQAALYEKIKQVKSAG